MFRWVPYAMVRIALFFSGGILLAIYYPKWLPEKFNFWILLTLASSYLIYFILQKRKRLNPVIGILGLVCVGWAGYVHLLSYKESEREDHLLNYSGDIDFYLATINKPPEEKENSLKYEILIRKLFNGQQWEEVNAKLLLYVRKEKENRIYNYGDEVLVHGSPSLLTPPQNPHEFDFQRFLSFRNIYHQQFVEQDEVQWVHEIETKDLKYYSYKARAWTAERIKHYLPEKREQAIALALTLGVTDGIDNELQSAYAASGAMHVLAVSGLHVGIIYALVLLIFKPVRDLAWSRWLIAAVSIVVLWSFAFITGLSPSVLRAVTMFTFIAIAKPIGRGTSIYNTLAGSAFLLLLYNPYLIMSVGFQLSYLAVLGIVTLHRPLYLLWEPQQKFLDWIWNISCVSIAAQMATFLLGLLYFHQFPIYFLISNLFVIPGAILILVTSIILVVVSFIPVLASGVSIILHWMIKLLNLSVFTTENLPFSLIDNVYLTTFQCWLLLASLFFFVLLLKQKQFNYLLISAVLVCLFSLLQWQHFREDIDHERLVVYNVPRHSGIEFIKNGRSRFYGDSALIADQDRIHFHIQPNRLFCGVDRSNITNAILESPAPLKIVEVGSKRIGLLTEPVHAWPSELRINYLVVANNALNSLAEIKEMVNFEKIILDSSNSKWLCEKLIGEERNIEIYSVAHEGAFIEKF